MATLALCGTSSCSEQKHTDNVESHNHSKEQHKGHSHDHKGHNHSHDSHANHNHSHASHDGHNHTGHKHVATPQKNEHAEHEHTDEISFSDEKAKHFGVETKKLVKSSFNDIIKVSGIIEPAQSDISVISAKSSGILKLNSNAIVGKQLSNGSVIGSISSKTVAGGDANEAARINYEAAKRELDRITPLYKDKIITEREYNQAKQVYEQAKAALANTNGEGSFATSAISGTITEIYKKDGEYVEVGTAIATVSKNSKLILRADLPSRYATLATTIKSANFKPAYTEQVYDLQEMNGKIVSNKNLSVVTPGYIPLNFEFTNTENIVPGVYADVYLVGTAKENCIALPISAVTEEQGYYFAYVKVHPETYAKREIKIGVNNGEFVEILSGLNEGEEVVVKGAILVKLASQANAVPGHTHDH